MDSNLENELREVFRARLARKTTQIEHSLLQIAAGNPLGAEPSHERATERISAKAEMPMRDSEALARTISRNAALIDEGGPAMAGAEAVQGPTIDFVGVEFLSKGRIAANAVGRIVFSGGRAQGSGFLVGEGLLLTNHHVITSAQQALQMFVEFDYEMGEDGSERPVTSFAFDPAACFVTDPIAGLDFTLVAVGARVSGTKSLQQFGAIPLSDAPDKHMLGELANIIQHPQGSRKQLVVRENSLVARDETEHVLHYLADTEKGSSGSPVCNNQWEAIALHHWGEPWLEIKDPFGRPLMRDVNEGIRISAIVRALRERVAALDAASAASVRRALESWASAPRRGPSPSPVPSGEASPAAFSPATGTQVQVGEDGSIRWTFPIEISVRAPFAPAALAAGVATPRPAVVAAPAVLPAPAAAERREEPDFSDREGYEPGFISGFVIPMPDLSGVPYNLARNMQAAHGEDEYELPYRHFSIVMNADRRLAAITACNIDGRRVVAIDRQTKTVKKNPTLKDLGVESLGGAEASDAFRADPRVLESEQMAVEFYENQAVPGYEKPPHPGRDATAEERSRYAKIMSERTARMFQKGHIIMRGDPVWGAADDALTAEEDTFFYTNAAPQLGFFNQGSADNRPGSKGKLRWRAVETFVLRNAVTMRKRVSVFAGPVFDDTYDVDYRFGSKVPMRFWKLVVWAAGGQLHSLALLADQKPVLERLTEGVPEAAEAYADMDELERVNQYLTTVEQLQELTGIAFGDEVLQGDIRQGEERLSLADVPESLLRNPAPARARASAKRKK